MLKKSPVKEVCAGLLVLAILLTGFGCKSTPAPTATAPIPANPFTTDYKLDQSNAAFFTNTDGIEMLLSASPFYTSEQPLPSQKTEAYDKARVKKVDEIKQEAQTLANIALRLKPKVDELRGNFLEYLQNMVNADAALRPFATEMMGRMKGLAVQEAVLESEYNGLAAEGLDNAFARSFMEYSRVVKAVELGDTYLEDIGNLAEFAALSLTVLRDNSAVKKANEKLDKDMKALDGLRADSLAIVSSTQKIDYGLKQLFTGTYYFSQAANDYMAQSLRDVEAVADKLTPREGLTKEDIQAIQGYLGLFERWQDQVKRQADGMDKSKLITVAAWHEGRSGIAYAAEPVKNYPAAVNSLQGPLKADEAANKKSPYYSKNWEDARKKFADAVGETEVRNFQKALGVTIDVVKLVSDFETNAKFWLFFGGVPVTVIRDDLVKDARAVRDNLKNNLSGVEVLKTAERGATGLEEGAGKVASTAARVIGVEDEWMVAGIGGAARLTVGLYTGLVKNMYTLANQQSTAGEMALALLGVALSASGGSKTVLSAAMLKSAEQKMAANATTAFVNSAALRQELSDQALKLYLKEGKAAADAYLRENAAKEVIASALQKSSEKILAELERLNKSGLASFGRKLGAAGGEALNDLFKKDYEASLNGLREALISVSGKNGWEYAVNLLTSMGDEQLNNLLVKVLGPNAIKDLMPRPQMVASGPRMTPRPTSKPSPAPAPGVTAKPTPGTTTKPTPGTTSPSPAVSPKPTPPVTTTPSVSATPKPSATPALTAARDLTGTWKGSGAYYQLDMVSGERARKITLEMTLNIKQTGNTVAVEMSKHITKQEPSGPIPGKGYAWKQLKDNKSTYTIQRFIYDPIPPGYTEVRRWRVELSGEGDYFLAFKGTVSATSMFLESSDDWEKWEFTFTTDLMSGGVKPVPQTNKFYFGHDSDPKAFALTRQK